MKRYYSLTPGKSDKRLNLHCSICHAWWTAYPNTLGHLPEDWDVCYRNKKHGVQVLGQEREDFFQALDDYWPIEWRQQQLAENGKDVMWSAIRYALSKHEFICSYSYQPDLIDELRRMLDEYEMIETRKMIASVLSKENVQSINDGLKREEDIINAHLETRDKFGNDTGKPIVGPITIGKRR